MRRRPGRLLWLALLCAACAQELEEGDPLPPGRFHYPTGVALTPEIEGVPERVLVVSANTDLRFRAGRVHAFDREALDRLVDEAVASCVGEDCPIPEVTDLSPALVGSVEIGSLAGEIAVTPLEGPGFPPLRAFVPVRGTRTVTAVDLDAEGIRCSRLDGRCTEGQAGFAREDPFVVAAELGMVFVGNGTLFRDENGAVGFAPATAPFWETGGGAFSLVGIGSSAVGGLAVGNCRSEEGRPTCTLFANGRSSREAQRIFAFDFTRDAVPASPVFSRNVASQQDGMDSRGIAISPSMPWAYLALRSPDALAVVDVSRMPHLPSDGCLLPEDVELPPGIGCPDLPPPRDDRPAFSTIALSPAPDRPLTVAVIERETPSGERSDLVAMTTSRSVAFFDALTAAQVGNVLGVGSGPSGIAVGRRGEGVRLYVPSFERSTLAVIDLPDLFRPDLARVVARLGQPREED